MSISNSRYGLLQIIHAYHGFTLIKTDRVYTALILFVCPVVHWLRMEKAGVLWHPAFNQFLGSDATDTYLVMGVRHFNMISARMTRVVRQRGNGLQSIRRLDPQRTIFQYPTQRQSSIRAFIRQTGMGQDNPSVFSCSCTTGLKRYINPVRTSARY